MSLFQADGHALITIYGDDEEKSLLRAVSLYLPDKDVRILTPDDHETLESAAQHSSLVIIGLSSSRDPHLNLGRVLHDNEGVEADIIAFYLNDDPPAPIEVLARGFDSYLRLSDAGCIEFKHYLATQIQKGARRLAQGIRQVHYKRMQDAISVAPVSFIVFDHDKKAVFVSDHYFRAYPAIARRLVRGLRVYDAFAIMAEEEGLHPEDERYEDIQRFWYNLDGEIIFTLDDGRTYRLKAQRLADGRGIVVTGQNISHYST